MTTTIEKLTDAGMAEIVARVAGAMESAVKDYGPDAVELALLAYRVQSAQYLLAGFVGAALVVAIAILYRYVWDKAEAVSDKENTIFVRAIVGVVAALGAAISVEFAVRLTSITHWYSVFGNPELLIATNALKAAGLM